MKLNWNLQRDRGVNQKTFCGRWVEEGGGVHEYFLEPHNFIIRKEKGRQNEVENELCKESKNQIKQI